MPVLHDLRLAALRIARSAGVMHLVAQSRWRRERLLILCYHGCSQLDEHEWNPHLYMSPALLRHRFEQIRRLGYQVLTLDDGLRALYAGTLDEKSVVLTFDDGAVDFNVCVVPLLKEFEFHATVYVSTYYVDKQLPVFDTMLRYLLWKGGGRVVDARAIAHVGAELDLRTTASTAAAVHMIREQANRVALSADNKDVLLTQLASTLGINYAALRDRRLLQLMTRSELADLPAEHVSVQLHTHRHRVPLDVDLFLQEIEENRAVLSAARPASDALEHFCYPSGMTHPAALERMRSAGVTSATTCAVALAQGVDDPLLLPRYLDSSEFSDVEFEGWLSGVSAWLPRRAEAPFVPTVPL